MSDTYALDATLRANSGGFTRGMRGAEHSLLSFNRAASGTGRLLGGAGRQARAAARDFAVASAKLLAFSASMVGGMAKATITAAGFETQMLNVRSILGSSTAEYNALSNSVVNLSRNLPQSAETLAEGLYDVASSGFDGAEGLMVMEAAAKAASAGLTESAVAATAITAVLNAYGKTAEESADVSDILFSTVNYGVITFEELSATVGEWVGIAAAAGVAADDAAAGIAAMTLSGVNSAEAATSLSRLLESFVNPSEELAAAAAELGYESSLAMVQTEGLQGAMDKLRVHVDGTAEGFISLFPNIRAARGAMALAADEGRLYAGVAEQITNEQARAGATAEVLAVQSQGLSYQWNILKNQVNALWIEFGQALLPVLKLVVATLDLLMAPLELLPDWFWKVAAAVGVATVAFVTLAGVMALMAARATLFSASMGVMGRAFTAAKVGASARNFGLLSRMFGRTADAAAKAATHTGMLRAGLAGVGAGASVATGGMSAMYASMAASTAVMGGMVLGLAMMEQNMKRAEQQGRSMAREFDAAFDKTSVSGLEDRLEGLRTKIEEVRSGMQLSGALDYLGSFLDPLTGSRSKAYGELDELESIEARAQRTLENIDNAVAAAILRQNDIAVSRQQVADDDIVGMLEDNKDAIDGNVDSMRAWILRQAEAKGVNLQQDVRLLADELGQFNMTAHDASANTQEFALAFEALGQEFDSAKDKADALKDVMDEWFQDTFGYDQAVWDVQDALNELFKDFEDAKEYGIGWDEVLDPTNFHEDSIAIKRGLADLTQGWQAQIVEFVRDTDGLTAIDLVTWFNEQSEGWKTLLMDMGATEEQASQVLKPLQELIRDPEFMMQFNVDVTTAENDLENFLALAGLADTEIDTVIELSKDNAQRDLIEYLRDIDGYDKDLDITTVITLVREQAAADLATWATELGLLPDEVFTLIKVQQENPEDLDELLGTLGVTEQEWEAVVELTGIDNAETAFAVLQELVDTWTPGITFDQEQIQGELDTVGGLVDTWIEVQNQKKIELDVELNYPPGYEPPAFIPTPEGRAWGGINRDPQITNKPILWGEAGPEAYIPLGAGKRGQAMKLWAEVGQMFGVRAMATGDIFRGRIRGDSSSSSSSSGGGGGRSTSGGGGSSQSSGDALREALRILEARLELGEIDDASYRASLMQMLSTTQKYSEEYMDIWGRLERANQDMADGWFTLLERMNETGELDDSAYLDWLKGQLELTRKYTDEWWDIFQTIEGIEDKRKQAEEDAAADEEDRLADEARRNRLRLDMGELTTAQYLRILRTRLAGLEKYGEEWEDVWREIDELEQQIVDDEATRMRIRFDAEDLTNQQYLRYLNNRLATLERFSEEWAAVWQEIQSVEDAATTEAQSDRLSDLAGSGYLSQSQVLAYYERKARDAVSWMGIVNELIKGGVSPILIEDLLSAGPGSLPLAKTLQALWRNGDLDELTNNLAIISGVTEATTGLRGNVSGGGSLSLTGTAGEGATVNFNGDINIRGAQTAKEFLDQVDFELTSINLGQ